MAYNSPLAYFITFTTYGTWLHGDERTSTDDKHNIFGTPKKRPSKPQHQNALNKMRHKPYILDHTDRNTVLNSIIKTTEYFQWFLFAAHIRSNHVHLVIKGEETPENIMKKLKAYASRELNKHESNQVKNKYWTYHGSTKYIWNNMGLATTIDYVMNQQGKSMACFVNDGYSNMTLKSEPEC